MLETREGALGHEQTLADFAAEQSVALTRFAYLLCGDRQRAEDLMQDALLALYRRFGDTLGLAAPVAYARKAIVNAHISQSRKRSASERVTDTVPDSPAPAADQPEQDAMWHALDGLPDRQRAVLVLRYYLDLSDPQIAAALGCREGTVRSLAARGFAVLRRLPEFSKDQP